MNIRTVMILLLFVILTWGGSAGIAYGVVELTGGGPPGPQGEQGERGERGFTGPKATTDPIGQRPPTLCAEAINAYEEGLSTPGLSEQQVLALYDVIVVRCGLD